MKSIRTAVAASLLAAGCTGSTAESWNSESQQDGIAELAAHCAETFPDNEASAESCNKLAIESLVAAETIGRCGPTEAVEAIEQGIPAESAEAAESFLRCVTE